MHSFVDATTLEPARNFFFFFLLQLYAILSIQLMQCLQVKKAEILYIEVDSK